MVEVVRGSPQLQQEVLPALADFWDGRDVVHLHHPLWFRQFRDAALEVRAADGSLAAYLLGCLTAEVAYVHVVAVRPTVRGRGVARRLYATMLQRAVGRGCSRGEAITTVSNTASVAFHRRLGFTATLVRDDAGAGQDRVLLVRTTPSGAGRAEPGRRGQRWPLLVPADVLRLVHASYEPATPAPTPSPGAADAGCDGVETPRAPLTAPAAWASALRTERPRRKNEP